MCVAASLLRTRACGFCFVDMEESTPELADASKEAGSWQLIRMQPASPQKLNN